MRSGLNYLYKPKQSPKRDARGSPWSMGIAALPHYNFNLVCLAVAEYRKHISLDGIAVNGYALDALAHMVRIGNRNLKGIAPEGTGSCKAVPCRRYGRINLQSVIVRNHT